VSSYNYKNCQSLFGYSAEVHIRCKGKCQLCGCGGDPLDFNMWRQMTVEHLIGKSQGGYLKQIKGSLSNKYPNYTVDEIVTLSKKLDALNTVTACQFCNSTTSRDVCDLSMEDLIHNGANEIETLKAVESACFQILETKKKKVAWKLASVKEAFEKHVVSKMV
jgi:hypothetical protein